MSFLKKLIGYRIELFEVNINPFYYLALLFTKPLNHNNDNNTLKEYFMNKNYSPFTLQLAEVIQYHITTTMRWVDDKVVYGTPEDWRVPDKTDENGLKIDDCDGYMSKAMDVILNNFEEIPEDTFQLYGLKKSEIQSKRYNPAHIGLCYCKVEKPKNNVDGTKPRGGHAILLLLNETKDNAYIIDNRAIKMATSGKRITQAIADFLNSNPFAFWIDRKKNPFNEQYAYPFVRNVKHLFKTKDNYLFLSGKCLGKDEACQDWTIYDHKDWQFIYPIMKESREIDFKETHN